MKSVLISINPKWCEKIASGEKTIEVRKSAPKEVPFKCYIYCTYGNMKENYCLGMRGKVIGEFVCDYVYKWNYDYCDGVDIDDDLIVDTCLDREEINIYAKGKPLYGWHISDLKIYDKPKELSEFKKYYECGNNSCGNCNKCDKDYHLTRPPESWQYIEDLGEEE